MMNIDPTTLAFLFAPAAFAFIAGGGYWAYAHATTSSPLAAAERFKLYTWALWPTASLIYFVFVYQTMPVEDRATLIAGAASSPLALALAAGVGAAFSVFAVAVTRMTMKGAPEDLLPHLTPELRELPGLVIVAPLAEEWVFRGYGALSLSETPVLITALITSAAFALIHYKPWLIVYSFFVGLALFFFFSLTGDILTAMIAHATANGLTWIWMRREAARLGAEIAKRPASGR